MIQLVVSNILIGRIIFHIGAEQMQISPDIPIKIICDESLVENEIRQIKIFLYVCIAHMSLSPID